MEEIIFPPSPSWFLPNIIAAREDGSICYGSKNNIVILQSEEKKKLEMILIQGAHNFRVTSVAFSPANCNESMQNTLVSSSEDCFVKLWDINTLTPTMGHKCHSNQTEDSVKVISLDWSIADPRYIVSVADNNSLVLWDIFSNTTVKFTFQKLGATVVSCCPYNDKVVAVGGKTGEIYIISLNENGNIIYKLRGHDNKIQSLSWCPIPYNVFKVDEIVEEFLLASGCQNKEIFIWRVGSDGKCENKFQVPTSPLSNKDGQHLGKIKNSFSYLSLSWLEAYKLYTSSSFGELIYFDLKAFVLSKLATGTSGKGKLNKNSLHFIKVAHSFHSKGLYAIAGLPIRGKVILYKSLSIESELQLPIINNNIGFLKGSEKENSDLAWDVVFPESSSLVWTAGQDRKLVACELKSSKMERVFNCHTLNGFVYCAVVSPHDPNKIAIGVGDGMIRLLNLTEPSGDIQVYWQKIKDRVMCLAWHPKKDGLLAYGTSEGRVGLLDTTSSKLPNVFKPSHPQPIYNLSWGPEFPIGQKNLVPQSEFDLYSVGNNILSLYQPSKLNAEPLNLSKIIPFPCKKQTDICWKPDYSLMAVGNEDGNICLVEPLEFKIVYTLLAYKKLIQSIAWHPRATSIDADLSPLHGYFTSGSTDNECHVKVFNCNQEEGEVKVNLVATLKGHYGHIQSVSWSPHISGRLISNSTDGSVQIWDVISQSPLVNFTPVGMPVFSIWSPINPHFIFTGCRSDIFYIWNIETQTKIRPSSNPKAKKPKKDKEINISAPKELNYKNVEIEDSVKSNTSKTLVVAESKTIIKSSKESKMFFKIWKNEDLKNCYYLLKNEEDIERNFSLSFLCDEEYFKESIKAEEEIHKKANNWTEFTELALWSGNIKEVLEEKIANGQLNDFLVSLAPSVSPRLWQEACLSYSATLSEKKFYRKAASYLLVCHKIYEAINLLSDASLYLEALFIARSRLPKSDPILKGILKNYAEWLFKNGSFLKACECYIALEEYLEVAKIFGKKNQPEYLSLAALAAKRSRSFDLEAVEAANAMLKCLETKNFDLAQQICDDHSNLKHLKLIFFTYRTIHLLDVGELELKKDILSYIRESLDTETVVFPDSLPKLFHQYAFYKQKEQVIIIVSQELSFAVCRKSTEETVTHLARALSICSRFVSNQVGETHLLYKLCQWLSPEGFLSEKSFFTLENNLCASKLKSLRAFLGASVVKHLSENHDTEDNLKWFDFLIQLREDLLDAESYKYFQNLIEVEVLEKRLLKNRIELSNKALANGKKFDIFAKNSENTEGAISVTCQAIESDESEKSILETNIEIQDENDIENIKFVRVRDKIILNNKQPADNMYTDENSKNVHKSLENCSSSEVKNENNLEERIRTDLDVLKKLKAEVEKFEAERISSPNPIPVYFMLKKLCEGFSENDSANFLLKYLNSKWQDLN